MLGAGSMLGEMMNEAPKEAAPKKKAAPKRKAASKKGPAAKKTKE